MACFFLRMGGVKLWRGWWGVVYRVDDDFRKVGRAFGSRVQGKAKPLSDLDLAVMGDTQLNFRHLAALNDAFAETYLPFRVDVVDWANLNEAFQGIIEGAFAILVEWD